MVKCCVFFDVSEKIYENLTLCFLVMNSRHEKSIILVVFWDAVFRHEKESVLLHLFEKLAPREEFPPTLIFGVI